MVINDEKRNHYRSLIIRCPRLGGEVPFSFCEREGGDLPCRTAVSCWQRVFPVEEYLRETMTQQAWDRLHGQLPKDRLSTILDIAAAAKKRAK